MARVPRKARVDESIPLDSAKVPATTGETLTGVPIEREAAALAGEINGGLDRENFRVNMIASEKFEPDTFNKIHLLTETTTRNVDIQNGALKTKLYDVPFGSGAFRLDITTQDVALEIDASVQIIIGGTSAAVVGRHYEPGFTSAAGRTGLDVQHGGEGEPTGPTNGEEFYGEMYAFQPVVLCIVVDGRTVARSGMQADIRQQCRNIMAYVPVAAGDHRIEIKAMMYPGRDLASWGQYCRVSFTDKALWCREVRR